MHWDAKFFSAILNCKVVWLSAISHTHIHKVKTWKGYTQHTHKISSPTKPPSHEPFVNAINRQSGQGQTDFSEEGDDLNLLILQ